MWGNPFSQHGACDEEPRVVAAVLTGRTTPAQEAHLAGCATCRELHDTVLAMRDFAAGTEQLAERRRLAESGALWWKAQLARRWEAEQRAVAPLDMMQRVEIGAGAVAALILLTGFFRSLAGGATADATPLLPVVADFVSGPGMVALLVALATVAGGTLLIVRRFLHA
jgi:hypothetical protein